MDRTHDLSDDRSDDRTANAQVASVWGTITVQRCLYEGRGIQCRACRVASVQPLLRGKDTISIPGSAWHQIFGSRFLIYL
jgi:hypothetical protein